MTGLAMLLIAASIAYNAFRGFYYDLIDLARDVLYKLGVWGLFTSGGLTIYDYAAGFINYLINVTVGPYLNAIAGEMLTSIASFWALFAASNVIGFDFASALRQYATDVVLFYSIFVGLAFVRYAILLAAVSLIPLAATLWIFEWTRPIAGIIVDLIVGLMASGIIAAITFALLEQMGIGIIIFLAGPIIGGVEFAVTLFLTFTSLKPHQHIAGLTRRVGGGSDGGGTQPPSPQHRVPKHRLSLNPEKEIHHRICEKSSFQVNIFYITYNIIRINCIINLDIFIIKKNLQIPFHFFAIKPCFDNLDVSYLIPCKH
ncbi:hypothetical protein [Sulfuracidifex tepidarius]|uniref:hypothetical protein n=1 Tax=Sulfuracidifex tepidarius TaxID=1294262 RepID=UPI0006D13283|nr:hypothetical protein [Sulfuracidifex tepidarius]